MKSHNLTFCIGNPFCFWRIMAPFPCCRCPPSVVLASHHSSSSNSSEWGPRWPAGGPYLWRWRKWQMRQCPSLTETSVLIVVLRPHHWTGSQSPVECFCPWLQSEWSRLLNTRNKYANDTEYTVWMCFFSSSSVRLKETNLKVLKNNN